MESITSLDITRYQTRSTAGRGNAAGLGRRAAGIALTVAFALLVLVGLALLVGTVAATAITVGVVASAPVWGNGLFLVGVACVSLGIAAVLASRRHRDLFAA
jgi:hypothetical protein